MEHHLDFFFTTLKTILLGFGPVDKYVTVIAHKHVADIAHKSEGLLYHIYMAEMA